MLYKLKGDESDEVLDNMFMDIYYDYIELGMVSIIEKQKEDYGSKN
jgi:hypothetical protein